MTAEERMKGKREKGRRERNEGGEKRGRVGEEVRYGREKESEEMEKR